MLDFIYDSLDTVKKLKFPTVKQIAQLTGAIFGLVIVAGLYFILADTIFSEGYKMYYSAMTNGEEAVLTEDEENADAAINEDLVVADENGENQVVFDNVEVEETPIETVEETETISE
ncbi:preprotein translocase subunit SecE [bacterium]|nr:preprotein translocase subunit SecE [bacterium]